MHWTSIEHPRFYSGKGFGNKQITEDELPDVYHTVHHKQLQGKIHNMKMILEKVFILNLNSNSTNLIYITGWRTSPPQSPFDFLYRLHSNKGIPLKLFGRIRFYIIRSFITASIRN